MCRTRVNFSGKRLTGRREAKRGAGEIVPNMMNQDGVRVTVTIRTTEKVARKPATVPAGLPPVARAPWNTSEAFRDADVDGALAASVFHKQIINIGELKAYPGNTGRGDQDMLTEQQRRELDWENRRTDAGDCATRGIRRSVNAGLYEPGSLRQNHRKRQSHSSRALNSDCGPKAKRRAILSTW